MPEMVLKGRIEITRSGMGFVIVDKLEKDILVRPGDMLNALHGDEVRVRVTNNSNASSRMQGVVTEVVSRKQTDFVGEIRLSKNFAFFVSDSDKPMPDVYIPLPALNGATDGQRVVVKILKWEPNKKPEGEVIGLLDSENPGDAAMKEILLENGFPIEFPEEVLEEAARLPDKISAAEVKKRKDFRKILTFTIDPVDAKDFDDAISYRKTKSGFEIGVHIADVSHYVQPDTALDEEAYKKATSVYLPDRVNPMLPEEISNVLCSLRPKEDKLAFSAVFEFNTKGQIKKTWLGRTVIHSDHRFTYEEVQEIIEQKEGLFVEEILHLNQLAQQFRAARFKEGAINFSSQEVRFKLDETGKPIGIIIKESKEAHQLIEEFMLLANRTVASYVAEIEVEKNPIPFAYRVHDQPDEEKLRPFTEFALKLGYRFDLSSPERIAKSFNEMLAAAQGKPEQHVLEQLGIRTMAKAVYTTDNIGHYGLGFTHYCHFTSPIRRYPDILVHRVLQECLEGKIRPDKKMEQKCRHSSERERAAMDCERAGNKYKQVEYMQAFLGEEFEGVITGVSAFGFWAETVEHKCEGLVSIQSLSDYDDFRLVESDYMLVGRRSGRKFGIGDRVRIRVISGNLQKRQLDYEWVIATSLREGQNIGAGSQKKKKTENRPKPVKKSSRTDSKKKKSKK